MTEEKNKREEFDLDLDTDSFETKAFAGVERDKRGELAVLLPAGEKTTARLKGFISTRKGKDIPEEKQLGELEKGSTFTGELSDENGRISIEYFEVEEPEAEQQEVAAPAGVDYGQTKVLVPGKGEEAKKPTIGDFDLDFSQTEEKKKASRRKASLEAKAREPEKPVVKKAAPRPESNSKPERREIPFDEPKLPDDDSAPVIIKGSRKKGKQKERNSEPRFPGIEAHSYLDEGMVVESSKVSGRTSPSKKTKGKMKLPKRQKERQTSISLVLLMILLFIILGCILSVQYVPEARGYYETARAELFGEKKSQGDGTRKKEQDENMRAFIIGKSKIWLDKNTDMNSAIDFSRKMRLHYSKPGKTNNGGAK